MIDTIDTHPSTLQSVRYWIFDMDGTLTHAIHDFDAIRDELGLPEGRTILESIAERPADEAKRLHERLQEIEWELVQHTTAQPGAARLLEGLRERDCRLGILTRNSRKNALETLRVCELLQYFHEVDVLGRDCAAPKPHPDGIQLLLKRWDGVPEESVMIGDYIHDLEAGRRAGVKTIFADYDNSLTFQKDAHFTIHHLHTLHDWLGLS